MWMHIIFLTYSYPENRHNIYLLTYCLVRYNNGPVWIDISWLIILWYFDDKNKNSFWESDDLKQQNVSTYNSKLKKQLIFLLTGKIKS